MEFYLAQGISVLTGIVAVVMMQFKDMRKILIGQILANLLTASTYFLLGGFSGAGICLIAIVQTVTMFLYNLKERPPHRAVSALFILHRAGAQHSGSERKATSNNTRGISRLRDM